MADRQSRPVLERLVVGSNLGAEHWATTALLVETAKARDSIHALDEFVLRQQDLEVHHGTYSLKVVGMLRDETM